MKKPINWFEIPALDLKRARAFYEQIFNVALQEAPFGTGRIAVFPYDREASTGGCVKQDNDYRPSLDGAVVYLNAGEELDAVLERVTASGGRIMLPKTALPPGQGAYAHVVDTEGNRVGIYGTS